jgi:hypothetical protein
MYTPRAAREADAPTKSVLREARRNRRRFSPALAYSRSGGPKTARRNHFGMRNGCSQTIPHFRKPP